MEQTQKIVSKIDFIVKDMNTLALNFSNNAYNELVGMNDHELSPVEEDIIVQMVSRYEKNLHFPAQVVCYIRGSADVYTSLGKTDYQSFEVGMSGEVDFDHTQFFSLINSIPVNGSHTIRRKSAVYDTDGPYTGFFYPIPQLALIPKATLVFFISQDDLLETSRLYLGDCLDTVFLYNEKGQLIVCAGNGNINQAAELPRELLNRGGIIDCEWQGGKYKAINAISETTGYRTVVYTSAHEFNRPVIEEKKFFWIWMLLLGLLDVGLALYLAKKSYVPIANLLHTVTGSELPITQNEFDIVKNSWQNVVDKNNEYEVQLGLQRQLLVGICLNKLLQGRISDKEEFELSLKCANITLNKKWSCVCIAGLKGHEELDNRLLRSIAAACEEFNSVAFKVYTVQNPQVGDDRLAIIINSDLLGGYENTLMIKNFLSQKVKTPLRMACGRCYHDMYDISTSFVEAGIAYSEMNEPEDRAVLAFEHMVGVQNGNYAFPSSEQSLYIQSLKMYDESSACKALDNIFRHIDKCGGSLLITQCMCFDVINMIIRAAGTINEEVQTGDLKALCTYVDMPAFKEQVYSCTYDLCQARKSRQEEEDKRVKSVIINYVNSHFRDNDMSLNLISDRFGQSTSFLSRFFKQETGCNFISYLTMLRFDWIKEQLTVTDKPIKDIACEAGYWDISSFMRKFKQMEGVTPGQYRENKKG
ncbi:MAG: AraC family transcriptional regulator [Angelakisella sp.]